MVNRNTDDKKIVILKTGQKLPSLEPVPGDFEDWMIAGMGAAREDVNIVSVYAGESLPDPARLLGVLITGSGAMVTDHTDWIERTANWVADVVARGIPLLGICFGHQLLAYALGGEVDDNPNGIEVGTVSLHTMDKAKEDPLLSGLVDNAPVHVSHRQSVLALPADAVLLAKTDLDRHHAFRVGDVAWGVQFHPEFSTQIVRRYVEYYKPGLESEHKDAGQLLLNCRDTEAGNKVLMRFFQVMHGE